MKTLEKDQLENLLGILGSTPSFQVAHFADSGETLTDMLSEYCETNDYLYQIHCTDVEYYKQTEEKFKDDDRVKVSNFPLQRRVYITHGREFNFLFVTSEIEASFRGEFLKRAHQIIRSAGSIVLFLPKKDYEVRDSWLQELEEN